MIDAPIFYIQTSENNYFTLYFSYNCAILEKCSGSDVNVV